jgi:hypothetical protein
MKIKAANSINLLFTVQDTNGSLISNLAEATAIKFMVKVNETDADTAAKISKSLGNGVTVNEPATGNIRVALTALNTTLLAGIYYMALQIEWGAVVQEVVIKETFDMVVETNTINIVQDIIR